MNLRNVDLNLLTVFDAVMAERNITRAAEKIGMSQPAVSIAISRFRHIAGDKLFERTRGGVKPTLRAQELAGPISRALATVSSALEYGSEFDVSTSQRTFNLALGDYGELVLLPRLARLLEQKESRLHINTVSSIGVNMQKEMNSGSVDLYVWLVPIEDEEIHALQIGTTIHACLVRQDHPFIKDALTLEQYASLRHLVIELPGAYGPSLIDRELWKHNLKREHAYVMHSFSQVPRIISNTEMVATLPLPMAEAYAQVHDLKVLPAPVPAEMPIFLMWHENMEQDKGNQWLRSTLRGLQTELQTKPL